MFLQQAFLPGNKFWKYILGGLLIFIANVIGQVPLLVAVMVKCFAEDKPMPVVTSDFMNVLNKNLTFFLLLLSFAVALVGIYFVVKIHDQKIKDIITSRMRIDWSRFIFAFSIWAIFQIITTIVGYFTSPQDFLWNFNLMPFLMLLVIAVVMVTIQTSVEELIFRGYFMQGFGLLAKNKWVPLLVTSVSFGLLHFANPEVDKLGNIVMIYYIGTGLFLGIITLMDEGMELSMGFHAANNLIGALLVTSDWSAFQTDSVFKDVSEPGAGFEVVLPVFIVYPILLFLFSKKYNWTNWKEKLTGKLIE
ncbi:CPBP family intramembrane glutamic endopeptidase [Flavobacterium terrae]|uniref:CAAX prenyl protease 2/Lysostaphin resistance protein A-like domain-containing protein n=1 Tax=Flavobacterium terrae TaxID=415425 RepID=A0A1M6EQD3_9FLAO|nr:CPBP family intramembrane glutamic endopeptidase [Flavobacterium terrae]SHI87694.1 hypothetical protein SAMN05444363_1902 [Flavobacterium terrae]